MKTSAFKTLATGIVAASLILTTSCKKGDTGPAGAAGTNGYVPTSSDGFIKGSISGTRQDGTAFNNVTFNYTNYWGTPSGTLDSTSAASYQFNISRGVDIFGTNSAQITVNTTTTNLNGSGNGLISLNNFSFTQSLGANKEFDFTVSNASATITTLSYNASTKLFTGNAIFTVSGSQNSTGNTATVSLSFQATITQLYMLVHHNSPNAVAVTKGNN